MPLLETPEVRLPPSRRTAQGRKRSKPLLVVSAIGAVVAEAALTRVRGGRLGGSVVVRCLQGHLFTTIWIPGVSVKSLRLGWWRVQYCPVGRHITVVAPVRESQLTEEQRRTAGEHHDIRVP